MQQAAVDAILAAPREQGYEPPRPEDWTAEGGESAPGSVDHDAQAEPVESSTSDTDECQK
ncbi:hypothetical protein KALB_3632 [Kutzneria albida DSM 43870]|uniref:Uncharacterized protein n=1 Tax=Kutzneria albida DSM 43870 TaxID=1449976 RepID=W5W8W1_9PSEU|nr:hypothetical protein KALB_3632 [Kutzneria albida DSM 43870]